MRNANVSTLAVIICLTSLILFPACDLRSDTAKREMEEFSGTPTPSISPTPTEIPIAATDILTVDTSQTGPAISIDGYEQKKSVACTKYNRVMVNGDDNTIAIKGACSQIMINGDNNQITADASMAYILNGSENTVKYSKYANGKRPIVTENKPGNTIEQISAVSTTGGDTKRKIVK